MMKRLEIATAKLKALAAAVLLACFAIPALAVQPDEILADPALEARARTLSAELRCLVCQNQSIDDSNAPLARDLRLLVRERLMAKDSDQAVLDFIVERYGDFVLLKPPVKSSTLVLWITPLLVLFAAFWLAYKAGFGAPRPAGATGEAPLSTEEKKRLDDVLNRSEDA
jgi:cytochrome c-type biogenesis protein CcmH